MRFYVGQSMEPIRRIMQHTAAASRQVPATLHYFILWKGDGRRAMYLLRLWTSWNQDDLDEEAYVIFTNLLEKSLAMAFQSLSLPDAETFFVTVLGASYSNVGLNVLSPLYQGIGLRYHVRQVLTTETQTSRDPQIRMWSNYRDETKASTARVTRWQPGRVLVKWSECHDLFRSAIEKIGTAVEHIETDTPNQFDQKMSHYNLAREKLTADVTAMTNEHVRQEYPVGNPGAKIGILLSRCILRTDTERSETESLVPWDIRESGFTDIVRLLWMADPREHSYTRESQTYEKSVKVDIALVNSNREIVRNSGMKVFILDQGSASKYVISGSEGSLFPFQMDMYCGNLTGYLELDGSVLKRDYLISSFSLMLWANAGPSVQRVCEMFRLAAALTSTLGIRPYFTKNISATHQILRLYREENNGATKMTFSTLTPLLQTYLLIKGFRTPEDISRIEEIGGSLTRGLVLLLLTIQRTPLEGDLGAWSQRPPRRPSLPTQSARRRLSLRTNIRGWVPFGTKSGGFRLIRRPRGISFVMLCLSHLDN
ncbi:hypothetical protein BDW69DRAFT_14442 [Aspergillus filifer]